LCRGSWWRRGAGGFAAPAADTDARPAGAHRTGNRFRVSKIVPGRVTYSHARLNPAGSEVRCFLNRKSLQVHLSPNMWVTWRALCKLRPLVLSLCTHIWSLVHNHGTCWALAAEFYFSRVLLIRKKVSIFFFTGRGTRAATCKRPLHGSESISQRWWKNTAL
jgi:hypothetical protein